MDDIENEGEFFALVKALAEFRAQRLGGKPSDRGLARAAGVTATTVGQWLRAERFPQDIDKIMLLVRTVAVASHSHGLAGRVHGTAGLFDEQRWRHAHRREAARRAQVVSTGVKRAQATRVLAAPAAGWPLEEVTDPFALEVHRPVQPDRPQAGLPVLPVYVPRDHDKLLAQAVAAAKNGRSQIVVLVGGSSTGKTRACWEALRLLRHQKPGWRLWHPIDPTRAAAAVRELSAIGPRTVVWLNEAQLYLAAADSELGEQVAAGLRELLRHEDRGPVLILATLWPTYWDQLTTRPAGASDPYAQARELLDGHYIPVPDAFTNTQLERLRNVPDMRLVQAAGAEGGQVTQYLAGVPELLSRYHHAPAAAKSLIHAAMDAGRLGMNVALPHTFLEEAAPGYLTDTQWDRLGDDWLEQALAYTAKPAKGIRGPLTRIRLRPRSTRPDTRERAIGSEPIYRLADYLGQHARHTRRAEIPPESFWSAAAHIADSATLRQLANAAYDRGLYRNAAQLHKYAIMKGNCYAAIDLVQVMHRILPDDHRPIDWVAMHAPTDDPYAVAMLLDAMREVSAVDQFSALAARGADQVPLHNPDTLAILLDALRHAGTKDSFATLAARAASYAHVEDPGGVARLLGAMHLAEARITFAVLARRVAAQTQIHDPEGVTSLLNQLQAMDDEEHLSTLLSRDLAAHVALDYPNTVAKLLKELRRAGADEQFAALANRAAAHAPVSAWYAVRRLLYRFRQANAEAPFAALAARIAAQAPLDDPSLAARLLTFLQELGANDQHAVLANRAVAHSAIGAPDAMADLLYALHNGGAREQFVALATRIASQAPLDDHSAIALLVKGLQELDARDQFTALADRAATHPTLGPPDAMAHLLYALHHAGAREQFVALATRIASQSLLDDPSTVARLVEMLHEMGAEHLVRKLSSKTTDGPAADPHAIKLLLEEMEEVHSEEQLQLLLNWDPASHITLDDPYIVATFLRIFREKGAEHQFSALTIRVAANSTVDDLYTAGRLLETLWQMNAFEQFAELAERVAAHVPLDDPDTVVRLLGMLRAAEATSQAAMLTSRLPAAGMFTVFCDQDDNARQFRYGRKPDGSPADPWTWNDLN